MTSLALSRTFAWHNITRFLNRLRTILALSDTVIGTNEHCDGSPARTLSAPRLSQLIMARMPMPIRGKHSSEGRKPMTTVTHEIDGMVGVVTLAKPPHNLIDDALIEDMR